jgi:hypothetical protein
MRTTLWWDPLKGWERIGRITLRWLLERDRLWGWEVDGNRSDSCQMVDFDIPSLSLSLSFLLLSLWGKGHPWNALFHFSFLIPRLGISPSQSRCLHKQGTNADRNHTLSGTRTHDPSVRTDEDSSCLRLLGHCVLQSLILALLKLRAPVSCCYACSEINISGKIIV